MASFLCKDPKLQQTPSFSATHFNRRDRQHLSFVVNHPTFQHHHLSITPIEPISYIISEPKSCRLACSSVTCVFDQHMILKDKKVLYLRIHLFCLPGSPSRPPNGVSLRIILLHSCVSCALSFELSRWILLSMENGILCHARQVL